jgi:hypothetical protein
MFVLLQIYPPEAADHGDDCCCLDVIAVGPSEAALPRVRRIRTPAQSSCLASRGSDGQHTRAELSGPSGLNLGPPLLGALGPPARCVTCARARRGNDSEAGRRLSIAPITPGIFSRSDWVFRSTNEPALVALNGQHLETSDRFCHGRSSPSPRHGCAQ